MNDGESVWPSRGVGFMPNYMILEIHHRIYIYICVCVCVCVGNPQVPCTGKHCCKVMSIQHHKVYETGTIYINRSA